MFNYGTVKSLPMLHKNTFEIATIIIFFLQMMRIRQFDFNFFLIYVECGWAQLLDADSQAGWG